MVIHIRSYRPIIFTYNRLYDCGVDDRLLVLIKIHNI